MLQSSADEDADRPAEDHASTNRSEEQQTTGRFNRLRRRRLLSRFSIQSKLVLMMVLCTIIAATVVGVIAFQAGRISLRTQTFNRLTEVRESQSRALQTNSKICEFAGPLRSRRHADPAIEAFTAGFDQLADATITPRSNSRSPITTPTRL